MIAAILAYITSVLLSFGPPTPEPPKHDDRAPIVAVDEPPVPPTITPITGPATATATAQRVGMAP